MTGRLIYAPDALEDLDAIWVYTVENWSVEQARVYLREIDLCCQRIAMRETRFSSVEIHGKTYRAARCEHHRIFFLQDEDTEIVAILHERMDLIRRLEHRL